VKMGFGGAAQHTPHGMRPRAASEAQAEDAVHGQRCGVGQMNLIMTGACVVCSVSGHSPRVPICSRPAIELSLLTHFGTGEQLQKSGIEPDEMAIVECIRFATLD
jgi:hypothetical protein